MFLSFKGQVALIVGTNGFGPAAEIYSPEGNCQHQLANLPVNTTNPLIPTLAYIDGKILSCGGHIEEGSVSLAVPKPTFIIKSSLCRLSYFDFDAGGLNYIRIK